MKRPQRLRRRRGRGRRRFALLAAAVALAGQAPCLAQEGLVSPEDLRRLRRTPVVEIFESARDSVVFVTGPAYQGDRLKLEEFFKLPGKPPLEKSVGGGFVVHPSGYIVANAHGVERIIEPTVVLADGSRHPAEVVGSATMEDVALLKIDPSQPLPAVRLAAPGDVMVGETVVVIGHPYGLLHSCTQGIVSGVGRATNLLDRQNMTLGHLLQTDAAINAGSSGGPWFNVVGEVMGMTVSRKGGADNVGFAIPAETIRRVVPELLDVERRYRVATGLEVGGGEPCRVVSVGADSPAARAGVRSGDVIRRMGGVPVPTALDYHFSLIDRRPGETIELELMRDDEPRVASMALGDRGKPDGAALARQKLGLAVAPLDPAAAETMLLRVPWGAVVTAVEPAVYEAVDHKPAPGDVLARINRIRPRDLDHLGLLLEPLQPGDQVTMVFARRVNDIATRIDIKLTLPGSRR